MIVTVPVLENTLKAYFLTKQHDVGADGGNDIFHELVLRNVPSIVQAEFSVHKYQISI